MRPLDLNTLKEIAASYNISYETFPSPFNRRSVGSRLGRIFPLPKDELYAKLADVGAHGRYFPHLRALNVITNKQLANVLNDNQVVVVEGMEEGGSKLGVKLFTFTPTDKIQGELMTDPFISGTDPVATHNKRGSIEWVFSRIDDNHTKMEVQSDFEVTANSVYIHSTVDHVWLDFFENLMADIGELDRNNKLCNPFPEIR